MLDQEPKMNKITSLEKIHEFVALLSYYVNQIAYGAEQKDPTSFSSFKRIINDINAFDLNEWNKKKEVEYIQRITDLEGGEKVDKQKIKIELDAILSDFQKNIEKVKEYIKKIDQPGEELNYQDHNYEMMKWVSNLEESLRKMEIREE